MQKERTPNKICSLAVNGALLIWFFLDMVGVYFDNVYLVTRSWQDDGVYFIIFLAVLLLYIFKESIGKYVLSAWLLVWLVTQFLSHEWFTLVGGGQKKIAYFKGALKWATSETRYIPDVYHTVLHILILAALATTIIYIVKLKMKNHNNR